MRILKSLDLNFTGKSQNPEFKPMIKIYKKSYTRGTSRLPPLQNYSF